MIILHEKGDIKDKESYRPVLLFTRILHTRIEKVIDKNKQTNKQKQKHPPPKKTKTNKNPTNKPTKQKETKTKTTTNKQTNNNNNNNNQENGLVSERVTRQLTINRQIESPARQPFLDFIC